MIMFLMQIAYAAHLGYSSSDSTSLTAVMAGCTCVGRIAVGYDFGFFARFVIITALFSWIYLIN